MPAMWRSSGDPAAGFAGGPRRGACLAEWRTFSASADETYLPHESRAGDLLADASTGAHVRDILRVYGDRMVLGLAEDNPSFASFNPGDDVWASYSQRTAP